MRINNPVKFSKRSNVNSADNELASIGDVKKICGEAKNFSVFAQEFSADGTNWHNQQNSNDIFVRYSFDGGVNWQIESLQHGDIFILKSNDSENDFLFNLNNYNGSSGSILLSGDFGDTALLGAVLSSIIESEGENIPSFTVGSNIAYDFSSTRNNR